MAEDKTEDTGPGREQSWGENIEARLAALEAKVHKGKGDKADKAADTKEDK